MNRFYYVVIIVSTVLAFAVPVHAAEPEWTQKDISEVVEKVKTGKSFFISRPVPADQAQVIDLYVRSDKGYPLVSYRIDLRAKICFFSKSESFVPVPCKSIKDGYPMFAPIIDWEK